MAEFRFTVNTAEVSEKLNKLEEFIRDDVVNAVRQLSIRTHSFIIDKTKELDEFKRRFFLGDDHKNVRWVEVSQNLFVVELDPSVKWIEEGRPATSMATSDWLLKPGKTKIAKDGSAYRSIPIGKGSSKASNPFIGTNLKGRSPIEALAHKVLKDHNINPSRIERNPDGTAKTGILHKVNVSSVTPTSKALHSNPRSIAESLHSGLKPHSGYFKLHGLSVMQSADKSGKIRRDVVVFRTVSSKHQNENRWMYPTVPAFNSIPRAYDYAKQTWENEILKALEDKFRDIT